MFMFLCGWPGMVFNQGQRSIVVSDWESVWELVPVQVGGTKKKL